MEIIKCQNCKKEKSVDNFISKTNKKNKTCNTCIDKQLEEYNKYSKLGICGSCKKNIPQPGKKTCEKCLAKTKKSQQRKRDAAKENNLCIACYKNPPENGYCKCIKCRSRDILSIPAQLISNSKSRAKKKNIEFSITETDLAVPEYCPILGIKLEQNKKISKGNSYSLDRIDSSKGYIKGNVQVISHRANQIKNDATLDELKMLIIFLEKL